MIKYYTKNPLLTKNVVIPTDERFEVVGVFNPGVHLFNSKTILIARVAERAISDNKDIIKVPIYKNGTFEILEFNRNDEDVFLEDERVIIKNQKKYLTSISHFEVFESIDGYQFHSTNVKIYPSDIYEEYGIEDARITKIANKYYITYSAVSPLGIVVKLMETTDFINFTKKGIILPPDNKDAHLFPNKINGKYYLLHRPASAYFLSPEVWISSSSNLLDFGNHRHLISRDAKYDELRNGISSSPILINNTWFCLLHGADSTNKYRVGYVLLDKNDPSIVIKRSVVPFLSPVNKYEREGFFPNVVFPCGLIKKRSKFFIYYGSADESISLVIVDIQELGL
ncbi:MAG: hypothetical protein LBV58_03885 [Acholeplasmatales bacterium]|jgi:predicted GH43/DUF377 family glycosyl hydrolase|nr:hypothetical protein [Acholeplasmatales bacterium]